MSSSQAEGPPVSRYGIGRSSLRKRKAPPTTETDEGGPATKKARAGPFRGPFDTEPEATEEPEEPVAATKAAVGGRKRKIGDVKTDSDEPSTKKTRVGATSAPVSSSTIVPASGPQTASSIAAPESKIVPASKLARARKPIPAAPQGIRRSNRTKKPSHKALEAVEEIKKEVSSQTNTSSSAGGARKDTGAETITPQTTTSSSSGGARKATGAETIAPQTNTSSSAGGAPKAASAETIVPQTNTTSSAGGTPKATGAETITPQTTTSSSAGGASKATGAETIDPQANTSSSVRGTRKATGAGNIGPQANTSSSARGTRKATGAGNIGSQAKTLSSAAVPRKLTRASTRGSYQEPPVVSYEWERRTEDLRQVERERDRAAGRVPPYIRYGYKEFWRAEEPESNAEADTKTPAQIAEYEREMRLEEEIAPILDLNERHEQMGFPSVLMENTPAGRMTFLPTDYPAFVEARDSTEPHVDLDAAWVYRDHTQNPISDERTPMPEPEDLKEARDEKLFGHYDYKPPFRHFFSKEADVEKFFPEMGVAADSSQHAQDNTIEGQREYVPVAAGSSQHSQDNTIGGQREYVPVAAGSSQHSQDNTIGGQREHVPVAYSQDKGKGKELLD